METKTVYSAKQKLQMGRRAGMVGIVINIALFAAKLLGGLITGSMSVIADAVNNITDAASSILVLLGYILAAKPPDKEHPYGHARIESLCSLGIAILVTVLGIELFSGSVNQFMGTEEGVLFSPLVLAIMIGSILVKIGLALYYRHIGKKIDSASLRASAADSVGDVFATGAVVLGILLSPVIGPKTDAVLSGGIAIYIFVMGIKLILEGVNTILGAPPDKELVKQIIERLKIYDGVLGIHDLVIHNYGMDRYFASVHLEMDADQDIMVSHDIIDNIEADFAKDMHMHLVIHLDPVSCSDTRVNELRSRVHAIVAEIAGEYSSPMAMHDFRAVFGISHSNLIFDIAVSHEMPLDNRELVDILQKEIHQNLGEEYNAVITIDRDYTSSRYGRSNI